MPSIDQHLIALAATFLLGIAVIDLRSQIIPNRWLIVAAPISALCVFAWSPEIRDPVIVFNSFAQSVAVDAVIAMIAGFSILALFHFLSGGGLGAGDVKLAAVIGLIVGMKALLPVLLIGLGLGSLITDAREKPTPLAPFLAASTIGVLLMGVLQ